MKMSFKDFLAMAGLGFAGWSVFGGFAIGVMKQGGWGGLLFFYIMASLSSWALFQIYWDIKKLKAAVEKLEQTSLGITVLRSQNDAK